MCVCTGQWLAHIFVGLCCAQLFCKMATQHHSESRVEFSVQMFESRVWKDAYLEDDADEIRERGQHLIYVVKMTRIAVKCSLPGWRCV